MKFEIELKDFWLDEEAELEPALKSHIITQITHKINDSIKGKVEKQIELEVKRVVEENLFKSISLAVKDQIATGTIRGRYGKAEVTIEEWIKESFSNATAIRDVDQTIMTIARKMTEELKVRYDMLFASQIVTKIKEAGFLKEDIAQMLLTEAPKG